MNKRHWLVSCSVVLSSLVATVAYASGETPTVIYGDDDRLDLYAVKNAHQNELADSTAALVKGDQLTLNGSVYDIDADTLGASMGLCEKERFFTQPNAAFCSGSLVGDDLLITAGHCITGPSDCERTKFLFNYSITKEGEFPTTANIANVVGCKEIVARHLENDGADYAVIRLDRKISNHKPLRINRADSLKSGDSIGVIGHPSGLPTKVAFGDSVVRDVSTPGYFLASLDTYGGNSGSAVFNAKSGLVEGILVRGERDFISENGCRVSNQCPATGCRGEDVTKISALMEFIPEIAAPRPTSRWPTLGRRN